MVESIILAVASVWVVVIVCALIVKRRRRVIAARYSSPYRRLRDMALNTPAKALGLDIPPEPPHVFGVVTDIGISTGAITIVTFETGDVSMYTSTGGGTLGLGGNPEVSSAGKEFVSVSGQFLDKAKIARDTKFPREGRVLFYFLTNKGIYRAGDLISNCENNISPITNLFIGVNKVITQIRLAQSK